MLAISSENYIMSMVKKSVPALKNIPKPTVALGSSGNNVILYGDKKFKQYQANRQIYLDSILRNQGQIGDKILDFEMRHRLHDRSFGGVDSGHVFAITDDQSSKINALVRRAKELGLYFDFDSYDDNDVEIVQSLEGNVKLGDVVKNIKIKDLSKVENVILQLEKAKIDSVYEIMQGFGLKNEFFDKKDIVNFLNSTAVKSLQLHMNFKISDVLKILQYDGLKSFERGLQSNSMWVQMMTLRTFFMPISIVGIPSSYPLYPIVLANTFSHALCELIVGKSLTNEEFKAERAKYGYWFYALEKSIMLAFWIVSVYVSIKVVEILYADVQNPDDELRMSYQGIILEALGSK